MIVDVSCDKNGGIETSIPTTFDEPVYTVDGVTHYVVDHTPSLFYKTFTVDNSKTIAPYIEMLSSEKPDKVLSDAMIVKDGVIIDERINQFQKRK